MFMSTTVLGGISAQYNIDDLSLLKFYTICGQQYANEVSDMEMAEVCFAKAAEFVQAAVSQSTTEDDDRKKFSSAMFDLLLGRAECAWDRGDSDQAERFVSDAHTYMDDLSDEHEFLASVEYNFGLFAFQAKETERALSWLKRSMQTRGSSANGAKDLQKQAKTARLIGVCLLALQKHEESWSMMKSAEEMAHDPVGSYLLLKLSIINKKSEAVNDMKKLINDDETSLDVCMASVALFGDAQRISDAAIGYEQLFNRFKDSHEDRIGPVGLRYFETLAALGRIPEALTVIKACHESFVKVKSLREVSSTPESGSGTETLSQVSKWASLLLATGCTQADRKSFLAAAKLLHESLQFSRTHCAISSVVLENEGAVCRLACSTALCAYEDLNRTTKKAEAVIEYAKDNSQNSMGVTNTDLLEFAMTHARRAKELDPSDSTPRLLIFRACLARGEIRTAADELRLASTEIRSFDPSALAEAACAAKDAGSMPSIIAALRCILKMDPSALIATDSSTTSKIPTGFFGNVLVSCVHILLEQEKAIGPAERDTINGCEELLEVLDSGLRGLKALGIERSFDKEPDTAPASLQYLVNVCWNKGRERGLELNYCAWEKFFDLSYQYSKFLPTKAETLQVQRMAKVMCASANIENPASRKEDFRRAKQQTWDGRRYSEELCELSAKRTHDPIEGLLLILEARSCIGSGDIHSFADVVESALKNTSLGPPALEQLAVVCYNCNGSEKAYDAEERGRCMDFTAALLSRSTDIRLCESPRDMKALALTMREHLWVELSRGSTAARAFRVFMKAVSTAVENSNEFPMDERRWLVGTGWDRAQIFKRLGSKAEARRWCEGVRQLLSADGFGSLSTYIPQIDALLESL